ncbi:unnamed protein product [Symbiodinium sp. CCMP2592]|nr:unnamed protein product [Symbiodinium sp. CCMP2592]
MQKPRQRHTHRKVQGTAPADASVDACSKRADASGWWPAAFWKGPASSLVVLGLAVCWMTWTSLGSHGQNPARSQEADGDAVKVLETAEDAHGHLVATVSNQELGVNFLTFGSSIIGAQYDQAEFKDQAAFTGFAVQESILFVNRSLRHVLQLGLGAGVVASYLRSHRIQVDVVELSDAVLYLAEKHFEFNSCCEDGQAALSACDPAGPSAAACRARQGSSKLSEARSFLVRQEATPRYDVVISDVFNGSNPGHMHSVEVFARLKDHWLIPGGILVLNFVGFHRGPSSQLSFDVATTLRAVFQVARCYRDQGLEEEPDMAANLVCFASDDDFRFNVPQSGDFSNPIPLSSFWVMQEFQAWEVLKPLTRTAGRIIQDSDNELLHAGAQSQIELQLRAHARNLIPEHVWKALGIAT